MDKTLIDVDAIDSPALICDIKGHILSYNSSIKEFIVISKLLFDIFIDLKQLNHDFIVESRVSINISKVFMIFSQKLADDTYLIIANKINAGSIDPQSIYQRANYDQLTQLPNRFQMLNRFEVSLELAKRLSSSMAIFFIDLDNFKRINDSLGHDVGDKYLHALATILNESIRKTDMAARWGGDEFLILCTNFNQINYIENVCKRIISNINSYNKEDDSCSFNLEVSIGVAIYPDNGNDINVLVDKADKAMFDAKSTSGNSYKIL